MAKSNQSPDTETTVAEEVNEVLPEETTGALVRLETVNIGELLSTGKGVEEILTEVRRHTADIVPDLSTEKGRKQVRSLAYRVSRTKSLLDERRLEHTKDLRDKLANLNANGKTLIDGLAKIRDDVKAPLEAWEAEEEARQQALIDEAKREAEAREAAERFAAEVDQRINALRGMPASFIDLPVAHAQQALAKFRESTITAEEFGERTDEAATEKAAAVRKIEGLIAMQQKVEEAERLAAEAKADQERAERQAQADREAEAERLRLANARVDEALAALRAPLTRAATASSADIDGMLAANREHVLDEALYGPRLGEGLRVLREVRTELEASRTVALACEEEARAAEAERARQEAERRARQRRDDIAGRIQALQTKVLLEAAACGNPQDLEELERRVEAEQLDPADFDDQWDKALESRTVALDRLHEMVIAKWQAHNDAIEASRLRQEAADREAREEQERQADAERAKQAANEKHRKGVREAAATALSRELGMGQSDARIAVSVIEQGLIPGVTLTF